MRKRYVTPQCFRRYYYELTWHRPNLMYKSRGERESAKAQLRAQLLGRPTVKLETIQVNYNEKMYEKTPIKGSSPEKEEVYDIECPKIEDEDTKAANYLILPEEQPLLQQQQQQSPTQKNDEQQQQLAENEYELNLTENIDTTHLSAPTTTTTTTAPAAATITIAPVNIEIIPQELAFNVPHFEIEQVQSMAELKTTKTTTTTTETTNSTKIFVFNMPRAFTSCSFENPISFSLNNPEDMVQVIAPQVRNLLNLRSNNETLQATRILEQINNANGMLANEEPSTSKKAAPRKRKTMEFNNNLDKKKRQSKIKLGNQQQGETEEKSLAEYYANIDWIFEDPSATPSASNLENANLAQNETIMTVSKFIV